MLRIVNTTELAHEHHGGSDASSAQIPAIALEWLKDASEGAESLITNSCFKVTFENFSQVDSMTPAQIYNYGSLLDAGLQLLEGIQICVAPLGRDCVKYMYPAADMKVADNKKIYINFHLLQHMCKVMNSAKSRIEQTELTMQFTSFLAGKIFNGLNHLLLALVDELDPTLNLIGTSEDGYSCALPKKRFGKTFKDFGNLIERACFGGLLLLECWENVNLGTKVLLAGDESLLLRKIAPTISSVGKGMLTYVIPAAEPAVWHRQDIQRFRGQKRPRLAAGTNNYQNDGGDLEESDKSEDAESEGEELAGRFLPVEEWAAARLNRRATARP